MCSSPECEERKDLKRLYDRISRFIDCVGVLMYILRVA